MIPVTIVGASGFIGRELVARLAASAGLAVTAAVRGERPPWLPPGAGCVPLPDLAVLGHTSGLGPCVRGAHVVINLAGLASAPKRGDAAARLRAVNVDAAGLLAVACRDEGVGRLVHVSSAKVFGDGGPEPYTEASPPSPQDAYAISKHQSEERIVQALAGSRTAWVLVRPPLVYGPSWGRSPIAALAKAVARGLPLPVSTLTANRRDLIGVANLAAFLELCARQPAAANQLFTVCDGTPLSTRSLAEALAQAAGRPLRHFPVPYALFRLLARHPRGRAIADRVAGSFRIDDTKARTVLAWQAPHPVSHDLQRLVAALR